MDEQATPNALTAAFPAPPTFWQAFTPSNIEAISKLRPKARDASSLPARILDLPPELRFLQPPEPPVEGVYRCFGNVYNLKDPLPSLEEMGIQQLYTPPATPNGKHVDRAFMLKRLAKSLLLNFLEFVGVLGGNPEEYKPKIDDLRTLMINFHHLLNEYRPHQARESLILMMQDQLERSRAETEEIRGMRDRVKGIIEGLSVVRLGDSEVVKGTEDGDIVEDGRDVWEELERQFG